MGFTPNDSEDVGSLSRSIDGMPEICLGFARLGDVDPFSWLYDAICEEFQDLGIPSGLAIVCDKPPHVPGPRFGNRTIFLMGIWPEHGPGYFTGTDWVQ